MATGFIEQVVTPAIKAKPLTWIILRWSIIRDLKKILSIVFGVGPVIRIVSVALAVTLVITVWAKFAFPQIQLGFVWSIFIIIPGMFTYMSFHFLLSYSLVRQVDISEGTLMIQKGQSVQKCLLSEITSSKLIIFSEEHIYFIVRTKDKKLKMAIAPKMNLHTLIARLPATVVIDKRKEFKTARALVIAANFFQN